MDGRAGAAVEVEWLRCAYLKRLICIVLFSFKLMLETFTVPRCLLIRLIFRHPPMAFLYARNHRGAHP
jgi:hypothetical protein